MSPYLYVYLFMDNGALSDKVHRINRSCSKQAWFMKFLILVYHHFIGSFLLTCQASSKDRFHTRDWVCVNIFVCSEPLVVFTPETNNNAVMDKRGDIVRTKHAHWSLDHSQTQITYSAWNRLLGTWYEWHGATPNHPKQDSDVAIQPESECDTSC